MSALFVTPLDVVKVRQQTCSSLTQGKSTIAIVRSIIRDEGIAMLWSGFSASLMTTVPSTVVYLAAYEPLRDGVEATASAGWAPLVAGGMARALAVALTAPVDLVRTRLQSAAHAEQRSTLESITSIARQEGARALWRGVSASMARDVPFSAIYWTSYEWLKGRLQGGSREQSGVWRTIPCASIAGAIAGAVTTPLDVVKTRLQVMNPQQGAMSCSHVLLSLYRLEGLGALFAGVVPRVSKAAPSCAIIIGAYEIGKDYWSSTRSNTAAR